MLAIKLDLSSLRIIEPLNQLDDGALSGARRPDDGSGLALLECGREVVEHFLFGTSGVSESHILELNLSEDVTNLL